MSKTNLFWAILLLFFNVSIGRTQVLTETKVGSYISNLEFGEVLLGNGIRVQDYFGTKRMNDKLLIIDFWSKHCSSCIQGFKHLSSLQERYKDKIQIVLYNNFESIDEIQNWLKTPNYKGLGKKPNVPLNLPMVFNKQIGQLFPTHGMIGYTVWINSSGKVILRGIAENNNEQKIIDFLNGEKISFIADNGDWYDMSKPLFVQSFNIPTYKSINFGPFNDSIARPYGQSVLFKEDTLNNTSRLTFANFAIYELIRISLQDKLKDDSLFVYGNRIILNVTDKTKLIPLKEISGEERTDYSIRKSTISYEQIVKREISKEKQLDIMATELNNYTKSNLSIVASIKKMNQPCWKIELRDSIAFYKRFESKYHSFEFLTNNIRTDKLLKYRGGTLREILQYYFMQMNLGQFIQENTTIRLNSGMTRLIDLDLPNIQKIESMNQLVLILDTLGIELKYEWEMSEYLVFEDYQNKFADH